jgi:intergrase/recombinase
LKIHGSFFQTSEWNFCYWFNLDWNSKNKLSWIIFFPETTSLNNKPIQNKQYTEKYTLWIYRVCKRTEQNSGTKFLIYLHCLDANVSLRDVLRT